MTTPKLIKIFEIIQDALHREQIRFAVIGALALGLYGLPRYTADIDLLTDGQFRRQIFGILNRLGYSCFQETDSFARFDSESGVLGNIDMMFVHTDQGREILRRCTDINDQVLNLCPVIQPSDFIILKLMAIANNPDRTLKDEADIIEVLKLAKNNSLSSDFEPVNMKRIYEFADLFRQRHRIETIEKMLSQTKKVTQFFSL